MLDLHSVLIVEDEPIIAFTLEDMLLAAGSSHVLLATRIDEAMRLLGARHFDAAILDVNIHGERSYPVARELQRRSVPFIFATGYGDAEHPDEFSNVPTVTKPYSRAAVMEALAMANAPQA